MPDCRNYADILYRARLITVRLLIRIMLLKDWSCLFLFGLLRTLPFMSNFAGVSRKAENAYPTDAPWFLLFRGVWVLILCLCTCYFGYFISLLCMSVFPCLFLYHILLISWFLWLLFQFTASIAIYFCKRHQNAYISCFQKYFGTAEKRADMVKNNKCTSVSPE